MRAFAASRCATPPQSRADPGHGAGAEPAGGYAFAVDDWTRLDRFLILGAEGGTYYASERTLTRENAQAVLRCLAADGRARRRTHRRRSATRAARRRTSRRCSRWRSPRRLGDVDTRARGARGAAAGLRAPARTCSTSPSTSRRSAAGAAALRTGDRRAGTRAGRASASPTRSPSTSSATAGRTATCCAWRTRPPPTAARQAVYRWVVGGAGLARAVKRGEAVASYPEVAADLPRLLAAMDEARPPTARPSSG